MRIHEAWSPYSRKDRKHVLANMSQRAYYSSPSVDCKNLLWEIAIIKKHALPCEKTAFESLLLSLLRVWFMDSCLRSPALSQVYLSLTFLANSCCKSWNELYFPDRSGQVKQFTAIIFQWKIHACNESQRSWQLFCHTSLTQICNTTWDKAGDMPSMVAAIIAAWRNWTIDYNASQARDVVISVHVYQNCLEQSQKHVCNGA